MPALPPQTNTSFDSMEAVLNTARVRMNDAIESIGGDVFTDNQPFTQVYTNSAWRRLQGFLASSGHPALKRTVILFSLPVVAVLPGLLSTDPGTQCWVNWNQFFDGYNYLEPPNVAVLPPDLIAPIRCWERPTSTGPTGMFMDMDRLMNGLPGVPKLFRNWTWEWIANQLVIPGATVPTDLWIRYAALLPDFEDTGEIPWHQQRVPIPRALDSLASYICAEVGAARGDVDASSFESAAQSAAMALAGQPPPSPAADKAVK